MKVACFVPLNSYRCYAEQIEAGNNNYLFIYLFFAATRNSCNFFSSLPFFVWNGVEIYSNKFLYCL